MPSMPRHTSSSSSSSTRKAAVQVAARLGRWCDVVGYSPGQCIFTQGSPSNAMYLVLQGRAQLTHTQRPLAVTATHTHTHSGSGGGDNSSSGRVDRFRKFLRSISNTNTGDNTSASASTSTSTTATAMPFCHVSTGGIFGESRFPSNATRSVGAKAHMQSQSQSQSQSQCNEGQQLQLMQQCVCAVIHQVYISTVCSWKLSG